jgi:hypothetical protein
MDTWLTDSVKQILFAPCLEIAAHIGRRLDGRIGMGQSIDERALTEDFVDSFDSSAPASAWHRVDTELRDHGLYLHAAVQKSTREHQTGADIGLTIERSVYAPTIRSHERYAVLIQCKKLDEQGAVADFFHTVPSSGKKQSSLLLDITPSSFYFIFTPPSIVKMTYNLEPVAFAGAAPGCTSPVWNIGSFAFDGGVRPFLDARQKAEATGILVVPALAVEAQETRGKSATIEQVLPNCLPFWYWFGELLVPGFLGDRRPDVLALATNVRTAERRNATDQPFGVQYSVTLGVGSG